MKGIPEKVTLAAALLFTLLAASVHAAQGESGGDGDQDQTTATDQAAGEAVPDAEKTQGQKEDILDRAFSPLDKAVSDINRTINEEGDGEASDPDN
jgi:hypothetical protein